MVRPEERSASAELEQAENAVPKEAGLGLRPEPPDPEEAHPPGAWWAGRRWALRALAPVERFLAIEAASGILLLLTALVALVWANSPWQESYRALWHTPIGFRIGSLAFERDLHFFINDGIMTVFFFVVGLEIRREASYGELSELRRAALPLAAALGGMIVPALVFFFFNQGRPSITGWGIPMATDIAFAVGVLTLLGTRVPPALRILLLALAVIDDVGAIVVIAVFYSSSLQWWGFAIMALGLALIVGMQLFGVRRAIAYVPPAVIGWAGAYTAGIHPTLAGVIVGLMTPAAAWLGPHRFAEKAHATVSAVRQNANGSTSSLLAQLDHLDWVRREAVAPLERLQHGLHPWVAFGAMPLFALANAGVSLGNASFEGDARRVFFGVLFGLLLGKPVGVLAFSWVCHKVGLVSLPRGVTWSRMALVGGVAGIGFTMSVFVAQLAFPVGVLLETAKVGVLLGSGVAAALAFAYGRVVLPAKPADDEGCAPTAEEAERCTEA